MYGGYSTCIVQAVVMVTVARAEAAPAAVEILMAKASAGAVSLLREQQQPVTNYFIYTAPFSSSSSPMVSDK